MKLIDDNKDKDPVLDLLETLNSNSSNDDKSLTMMDFTPGSSRLLNNINTFARNASEIDPELYKKYKRYGIEFDSAKYNAGILDKQLADTQSNWEKIKNALDQTVVNEVVLGTLTGFADLYDIVLGRVFNNNEDYQNPVSSYLEGLQEQFRESHPIYQDPSKIGWSEWSDFGWWMNNVPSIMSSLTLLIPGAGVGKGVSYVGKLGGGGLRKLVSFSRKRTKAARAADKVEDMSKLGRFENFINRPSVINQSNKILEAAATGTAMRMLENYQESRQVYNDMMSNITDSMADMSPEERQDLIDRNRDLLEDSNIDLDNDYDVARIIAKEAADRTFQIDMANLIFDIIQVYTLGNSLKGPKSLRTTAKINKAQRESKIFTKLGTIEGEKYLANRSFKQKATDWISDHAKAKWLIASEMSEGVEEAVNYVAQQEGMNYGTLMLNPKDADINSSHRWQSYLSSSELYESAFWGVLGGVVFQGGGNLLKRTYGATKNTITKNKNANETTHEGNEKTSWKAEFESTENKTRVAEINSRIGALNTLKERRAKIFDEHKSPFTDDRLSDGSERSLDTQLEREAAWERAVDDYIINQTFMAMDAGNFDLFKEYLRDPGVREVLESIGQDPNNPAPKIDIENLISRMDEIEKIYTDNLIVVNSLAGDIKNVPIEYVNIIARENTMAQIKAQRIQSKIDAYEQSAEANRFRFGESLKEYFGEPSLDYKTAISLVTATNYLKELNAAKQKILADEKRKGSVEGQLTLQEIDSKINSLTNYVKDLQPSLVGYEGATKLFGVINSLFATQHSLDPDSVEYTDFLSAVASRDMQKINQLTGNNFELTDEEILKVFGEPGTATGAFYKLSSELLSHFGVRTESGQSIPKFVELAPNLADDYTTIASLNVVKLLEQSKLANTRTTVNNRVQSLNNTMNEARKLAIVKSRDIIVKNAKKYGRAGMIEYVFSNTPINGISEEDKRELDDAIAVLNLTNPLNKNVADLIYTNILLGDYEASVEDAKKRKSSSASEKSDTGTSKLDPNKPLTEQPKPNTTQETPIVEENSSENNSKVEETNPTQYIEVKDDVDSGVSFNLTSSTNANTLPFKETKVNINGNENDGFELALDDNSVSKDTKDSFVRHFKDALFDGYDKDNTNDYEIVKNPILVKQDDGKITIAEKGEIRYKEKAQPTKQKDTILPTGDEEEAPSEIDEMSEEDAAREAEAQKHNERDREVRREVFTRILRVVKPIVDSGKSKEEIDAAVEAEAAKYRTETEDSDEFESSIQATINVIKEKYDLVGVAKAVNDLRSSTVVEKGKELYTQDFINKVYELVKEYTKAAGIKQGANGKYYINFEDFIRNLNNLYPDIYQGEEVYNLIKGFINSSYNTQVVVTDNPNDPNILENAKKSAEERLKERIGSRENYRVGIDDLFDEGRNEFINEFNKLKVGQKLELGVDGKGHLAVLSNGVVVGIIGKPKKIHNNTGFEVTNKGWITDAYENVQTSNLRNHLSSLTRDDTLNDMINSYLYDKLDDDKKTNLTFKIYEYLKSNSSNFIDEKYASPEDIVDWIANIWRYRMTPNDFSKPAKDRSTRIDSFIDRFFKKLYDSYSAVSQLIDNRVEGVEITIVNINDGELLRVLDESEIDLTKPRQSRDNYNKFTQSNEALSDPDNCKVGAVTANGVLGLEKNESLDHTKLGTKGTVHIVIPNRSGKPQFAIATSVLVKDENLSSTSDAAKIIQESKNYIKRALDEFLKEPSNDNYRNLVIALSDLMEHDNAHASIFGGVGISFDSSGNISLSTGKRYLKIYKRGSKENIDFIYNDGKQDSKARPFTFDGNEKLLENALLDIFNQCFFNVDFKFINDGWNENNGAIGYTNDGKQFVIKVNGKVFRYKSMSEAFIKGGLLRVNTKVENGTNYRRKGLKQGGNQILEVSFSKPSSTPVERNDGGQSAPTSTTQEITGADILNNEDANDAVDKLVTTALPNLKKSDKKGLKDLGLLPKSIIFVSSLTDSNGSAAVAQVNTSTGETKVSQTWLDMYDGNGEFSTDKDFYRKQAIRKLIHEMVHVKIAENNRDEILKQVERIYNEFESYLNTLNEDERNIFNKYLFKDKTDFNERLEEFLVESFTSQELSERLNNIEATYEEGELDETKVKETLWDKILKLIAKIFNYSFTKTDKAGRTTVNINKQSLLQKELYALAGALNTHAETNTEGTPTPTITESKSEEEILLDDDSDFNTSDGNDMYSTVIENIVPENVRKQIQAIEKEMQDIKSKAIADGTFMKAPNGNPTNLNERQWLQVRTKNFINWFGDWINASRANMVSLGKEIPNTDKYSKYGQKGETDIEIREVLDEKGNVIGTVRMEFSGKNRKGVVTLHPQLSVTGEGYGTALYQHIADTYGIPVEESFGEIGKSEAGKALWNKLQRDNNTQISKGDIPLRQLLPTNASKVVDENGEPLQVYHHTNNPNLTEFSTDFENYFSKDGGTKEAIFFDENETGTLGRKYDIPVFLNIRELNEYNETKQQLHDRGTTYREVVNQSAEKNNKDGGVHMKDFDDNRMEHQSIWIVHNPNQIKSATDNVGTFSNENNDIRYSSVIESAPTHSSSLELISSLNPIIQSEAARMIEDGELSMICK